MVGGNKLLHPLSCRTVFQQPLKDGRKRHSDLTSHEIGYTLCLLDHPGCMHCQQPHVNSCSLQQQPPVYKIQCLIIPTCSRQSNHLLALFMKSPASLLQSCIEPQLVLQSLWVFFIHPWTIHIHHCHPHLPILHSLTHTLVLGNDCSTLCIQCCELEQSI